MPQTRHHNTITVAGLGQGVEGDHDVWRGTDYARLDATRIISVSGSRGLRIDAEAAGAYRPEAGVARFTRTFEFDGAGTFAVKDEIRLSREAAVQWYLHTDNLLQANGGDWIGVATAAGSPVMRVAVKEPAGLRGVVEPTPVATPGQPGSITKGVVEQRGHELRLDSPKAQSHRFHVVLSVEPVSR
jgi:hypothetical protein